MISRLLVPHFVAATLCVTRSTVRFRLEGGQHIFVFVRSSGCSPLPEETRPLFEGH